MQILLVSVDDDHGDDHDHNDDYYLTVMAVFLLFLIVVVVVVANNVFSSYKLIGIGIGMPRRRPTTDARAVAASS
jgi:hypothetical protein